MSLAALYLSNSNGRFYVCTFSPPSDIISSVELLSTTSLTMGGKEATRGFYEKGEEKERKKPFIFIVCLHVSFKYLSSHIQCCEEQEYL